MAKQRSPIIDTRVIYCGDCLDQLRQLPDGCVDLVYIDPPFNSNRNYEVFWGEAREKRCFEDRHASTAAYIEFMRPRCVELARVLKKTGSLYYHCDWHASHYIKVMLDEILGEDNFINEIIWKRQSSHNDAKQGARHLGRVHDTILLYGNGEPHKFRHLYRPYEGDYVDSFYRHVEPNTGRRYRLGDLTGPGGAAKGNPEYELMGVTRFWRYSQSRMKELVAEGRVVQTRPGAVPQYKRYLDEGKGVPLGTVWDDINPESRNQRVGYPTQKPLSLLERILEISTEEGDVVLDAFCGCGTALEAAETSHRRWIGIDLSPTACRVMADRLRKNCGLREDERLWKIGRGFVVRNLPFTEEQLRKMPPFEFENWAITALGGITNKSQVGDMGIDGRVLCPVSMLSKKNRSNQNLVLPFMEEWLSNHVGQKEDWIPIQVKQKDKAGRPDIDQFEAAMLRANRSEGYFVSFDFTSGALREIERFSKTGHEIVPVTVRKILEADGSTASPSAVERRPAKSVRGASALKAHRTSAGD